MQQNSSTIDAYLALLKQLDTFQKRVLARYGKAIACRRGCSSCCILETVFPIEAWYVEHALGKLSNTALQALARQIKKARSGECVLLVRNQCLIYKQRPIICRTHGLPLIIEGKIDFCDKNFKGVSSLDGQSILDLEKTTMVLAAINLRFLKEKKSATQTSGRVSLREIVDKFI